MAKADGWAKGPLEDAPDSADQDILDEARERFQLCTEAEDRDDAMEDLRFLRGDQWDEEAAQQRELDNRPCLTFNNMPAIVHQVTNDARQNKQSIQVHPTNLDADAKVAEVMEGMVRHIEYDSGADAAYDTALDGAASIGFGYFRLVSEYSDPMAFTQDLKIKRIRNPFRVHTDPNAQEADSSDMQFAFVSSRIGAKAFKRLHPNATASQDAIGTAAGDSDTNWFTDEYVRIAEYYRIEYDTFEISLLGDGTVKKSSEVSAIERVMAKRMTSVPRVMWYKITGAEILERAEIPCKWIPIFPVYGDEIDIDGQITRYGLVRNAKSPKMMENYWMTAATEEIALRTKTPFIGALGQFENLEKDWEAANIRNYAYLEYNPITVDGQVVPAPTRQPPADVPAGFIAMAGLARDTVKAVTGIYDASLGNRSNEVSGLAIRARQQQGDVANFHYTDNLTRAIRHLGRCIINMMPKIYDTERVARVLGEDRKTSKLVQINTPVTVQTDQGAIRKILNDLTIGTYDVVVTTGPAYNTQREEMVANMVSLGKEWPQLMQAAGDKVVRAMDWPGAEEIADRLEKLLPPQLRDSDGEDQPTMVQTPKGPIPAEQAGQLIAQMDQAMSNMQGRLEELESGIEKTKIETASREEVARITAEGKHIDTELAGAVQLILARLDAQGAQLAAIAKHDMDLEKMGLAPAIDHAAAVTAAADEDHPAPSAEDAQAAAAPQPEAQPPEQ